jgi:pSer/pThr/pTyr-binding forkhead associated (FHA) protein
VVTADRSYYDAVQAAGGPDAGGIAFPGYFPQRRFPLGGAEVRIGRRSASSGISPEIDLSVAPADPGISRLHAVLLRAPDGSWSVVDPGSANGTVVNGSEIPPGEQVPLHDGDRINLGAWTELRLVREPDAAALTLHAQQVNISPIGPGHGPGHAVNRSKSPRDLINPAGPRPRGPLE